MGRPRAGLAPSLHKDPRDRHNAAQGIEPSMIAPPFYIDAQGRLALRVDPRGPLAVRAQGTLDFNVGDGLAVQTGSPPRLIAVQPAPSRVPTVQQIQSIADNAVMAAAASTPPAADGTISSNISGAPANPTNNLISAVLDYLLGSTRGSIAFRGAAGWTSLPPGTAGSVLTTHGAGADPTWVP